MGKGGIKMKTTYCPLCGHTHGNHRVHQDGNRLFIKCVKWIGTKDGCECNAGFGELKISTQISDINDR